MTQASSAQEMHGEVAWKPHAKVRSVAQRRADLEKQIREVIQSDPRMALTEPSQVRQRMKLLRERAGLKQYEVAAAINEPPRTYQSWELAEVETDRKNYEKVAKFFSTKLKEKVSANWILFGQDTPPAVVTPTAVDGSVPPVQQLDRIEQLLKEIRDALTGAATSQPAAEDDRRPLDEQLRGDEDVASPAEAQGQSQTPHRAQR